jgi:hypothetical protein
MDKLREPEPIEVKYRDGTWLIFLAGYKIGPFPSQEAAHEWMAQFRSSAPEAALRQQTPAEKCDSTNGPYECEQLKGHKGKHHEYAGWHGRDYVEW